MPTQPTLLIATNNRHKIEEMRQILIDALGEEKIVLAGADEFPHIGAPDEDGETFEDNALIKARAYAAATGLPTLADDSGLVVDALGGRPGVLSARYAATTEARNNRVLAELAEVSAAERTARFVCVAALVAPDGTSLTRRGTVEGRIARFPRGENGFGYDPIFENVESPFAGRTMAELTAEQKHSISHRGRALRAIAPCVATLGRGGAHNEKP